MRSFHSSKKADHEFELNRVSREAAKARSPMRQHGFTRQKPVESPEGATETYATGFLSPLRGFAKTLIYPMLTHGATRFWREAAAGRIARIRKDNNQSITEKH
ncbi:MAG: hypothetical protein R3C49_09495 [Planctomycetaceae bacterium]